MFQKKNISKKYRSEIKMNKRLVLLCLAIQIAYAVSISAKNISEDESTMTDIIKPIIMDPECCLNA